LGPHTQAGIPAVRAFLPGADSVEVLARETGFSLGNLQRVHPDGFWSGVVSEALPYRLKITEARRSYETEDPYSFPPILGDIDIYLLGEGRHRDFASTLGAHVTEIDGISGVRFAVWAPNARRVSVVGAFNSWDGRRHPMRLRFGAGVWELFIPRLTAGALYKYEIVAPWGETLPLKADPVAWAAEVPPATASIVASPDVPEWRDAAFVASRGARQNASAPMSIYEVHATSWMPAAEQGGYGWAGLAAKLVPYVKELGFTHVELLPVMEHPFGGSWGYQPLGQFAPNSRLGPPQDFAAFVERCHEAEIGVILDWVPAHFPTDAHGLARFDGTPLYEHADPREGFHRDWNTFI
jgi:1,4-alpha-glucan branching enzyme